MYRFESRQSEGGARPASSPGPCTPLLAIRGLALLVIGHNFEHVFSIADRVAVMKTGALVDVVRTKETQHDDIVTMIVSGRPIAAKVEA